MIIATHGIVASYIGIDSDAQAFITAANITDTTQQNAIKTLVSDLKSYGLWTKMKAIYPFVGATASSHKFNLKDPRDLDIAFRLQFVNGWTHSSTGAKPNGTDAYAKTFLNPSIDISNSSSNNHISIYLRDNINELKVDMGVYNGNSGYGIDIESNVAGSGYYTNLRSNQDINFTTSDSRGFHINSRTASNTYKVFVNNLLKGTDTNNTTNVINGQIALACRYNVSTTNYDYLSSKQQAFATIGEGLTNTDATNLYISVNTYQVSLSRNV
jgi:hypothetical protein